MDHERDLRDLRDVLAAKVETRQDWCENRISLTAGQLQDLVVGIIHDELRVRKLKRPEDVET